MTNIVWIKLVFKDFLTVQKIDRTKKYRLTTIFLAFFFLLISKCYKRETHYFGALIIILLSICLFVIF